MRGKNLNCGIRGGLWDEAHLERMGAAVWLFGWLVHRQTRERDGVGLVLGGSALTYEMIQGDTGYSRRTLQRWMADLRRGGYVRVRRTCHSRMIIEILKAKKFGAKQLGFPQANFFASNSSAPTLAQKRPSSAPYMAQKNAGWPQQLAMVARSYAAGAAGHRQYKPERQIDSYTHSGNFPRAVEETAWRNPAQIFSQIKTKAEAKTSGRGDFRGADGAQTFARPTCASQMSANRALANPSDANQKFESLAREGKGSHDNSKAPRAYAPSDAYRFRQSERALREEAIQRELRVGAGPDIGGLRTPRREK